jgi:hypothetical protein
MFINYELIKDHLNQFENTIFLNRYENQFVELTMNFVKSNPEIRWYDVLPELLDEEKFDNLNKYIGPKLTLFNARTMELMYKTKNNVMTHDEYDISYEKMLSEFEFDIISQCIDIMNA